MRESFNETPIVTYDTSERPDVSVGLRRRAGNDRGGRFYGCLIVKRRCGSQVRLRLYTTSAS